MVSPVLRRETLQLEANSRTSWGGRGSRMSTIASKRSSSPRDSQCSMRSIISNPQSKSSKMDQNTAQVRQNTPNASEVARIESMARELEKSLLSAEDVAELLGVKETTVWRWCREGTLPCLKVGKHWRIRREVLEDFLKRSERPATLVRRLESFLQVPDNVLAIAQNADILRRLDAAFFQVGEARGGLLVKFYGGEKDPEDELRAHLEQNGLEVGRLEREGRLLMRL